MFETIYDTLSLDDDPWATSPGKITEAKLAWAIILLTRFDDVKNVSSTSDGVVVTRYSKPDKPLSFSKKTLCQNILHNVRSVTYLHEICESGYSLFEFFEAQEEMRTAQASTPTIKPYQNTRY